MTGVQTCALPILPANKCPHVSCNFSGKNLQGVVRHLNAKHTNLTTSEMLTEILSSRSRCECRHTGTAEGVCSNCKRRTIAHCENSQTIPHHCNKVTSPPQTTIINPAFKLPDISQKIFEELMRALLPTIPKLTPPDSSTFHLLGRGIQAALWPASDGRWSRVFALPQLILWIPPVKFTPGFIAPTTHTGIR